MSGVPCIIISHDKIGSRDQSNLTTKLEIVRNSRFFNQQTLRTADLEFPQYIQTFTLLCIPTCTKAFSHYQIGRPPGPLIGGSGEVEPSPRKQTHLKVQASNPEYTMSGVPCIINSGRLIAIWQILRFAGCSLKNLHFVT